jgi:hypothetical protein
VSDNGAFDDWIQQARDAKIEDVASVLGIRMPARGEYQGPCPIGCCETDGFSINSKKGVFLCRKSGAAGDAIAMVQHVRACEFVEACEFINETPPPRGEPAQPRDPAIEKERREERRDEEIARRELDAAERRKADERAEKLFAEGRPIELTAADDYLERRGIGLHTFSPADLRFVHNLPYRGFLDRNSKEVVELGAFDCMLAAMRGPDGSLQGVHRTYLDPTGPRKLRPPGDNRRNAAKKGTFRMGGGLILLSEPSETLAIAEGIETACSWRVLAREGEFGDMPAGAAIAAAYSLGNMCGAATGTRPHPHPPRGQPGATIANGEPDMGSGAMWVPPWAKRVILIGDGDSDPAATRAMLATGAERFRRLGLDVFVHFAPDGQDWNDVLLSSRERIAA